MIRARRDLSIALLALTGLTLAACGGDDSSTKGTEAAAVETTAAAPETVAPATTEVVEETVAPETTESVETYQFTTDDLVAAMPVLADLGEGWTDSGTTPLVAPEAKEGPGFGTCGGPNAAARAAANGATAVVISPLFISSSEGRATTTVYAFSSADAAQAFIDLTATTSQCEEAVTWDRTQKANPTTDDEFNGFAAGFEEVTENQIWHFAETAVAEYADAEDRLGVTIDRTRDLTAANITFHQTDTTLSLYDRYDNVVIVNTLIGSWDMAGYINLDQQVQYEPTWDDLEAYMAIVMPIVLQRLGWE